jgi:hypothetical protein
MEVYAANDATFRNLILLDNLNELVWTERYSAAGDFEMTIPESSFFSRLKLNPKYLLSSDSNRVMQIDTVTKGEQIDGINTLKVSGFEIVEFLKFRSAKHQKTTISGEPETFRGSIGAIARWVVNKYCVDPATAGVANVIPNLSAPAWTGGGTSTTVALDRDDIYSMVKTLCESEDLGFRIVRSGQNLIFQVYKGEDKSIKTAANYMTYSSDNETFMNQTYIESTVNFVNNVRVIGAKTYVDVYADGYSAATSGWDRRTAVLEFSDIGSGKNEDATSVADDQSKLRQKGREYLRAPENKYFRYVEGEIPPEAFKKITFALGDVADIVDTDGQKSRSRIVEIVRSIDKSGAKTTPTFEAII